MEQSNPESIRKINIFDFDGTLVKTPNPDAGKAIYKHKKGEEYPHVGWWGRVESLDVEIFQMPLIQRTVRDYNKESNKPDIVNVMMTGRAARCENVVKEILHSHNLHFNHYFFRNGGSSTIDYKLQTLAMLKDKYNNANEIEIWEDREEHIAAFEVWSSRNFKTYSINFIR